MSATRRRFRAVFKAKVPLRRVVNKKNKKGPICGVLSLIICFISSLLLIWVYLDAHGPGNNGFVELGFYMCILVMVLLMSIACVVLGIIACVFSWRWVYVVIFEVLAYSTILVICW